MISSLEPDSASIGDELKIRGSGFGSTKGSSTVQIGGAVADSIIAWSNDEIEVRIPAGAVSGTVTVTVGGRVSNTRNFALRGTTISLSFAANITPILNDYGCNNCHGGSGGLGNSGNLTVALLLQGGNHGPAIVPGNGNGSTLVMKLKLNPSFGSRMPVGGPYMPDSTIQVMSTWINQGANL